VIAYRMMDTTCLLSACLHDGPAPLASLREALAAATDTERQEGLAPGALARFLEALCQRYGSGAVLAVEGDLVVGKLRFAPAQVGRMLSGICFQQAEQARRIAQLDLSTLPTREALEEQRLRLDCYQVARGYRGRGLAKHMLDFAIAWARATGWEALSASAIRPIPPLLDWSGQASLKAMQGRGFVVTSEAMNADLREGVVSQRLGYHGQEVKRQWAAFADLSDDDAATFYEMALDLRG
jgi:GNAT superfamily N-acetyltransferase